MKKITVFSIIFFCIALIYANAFERVKLTGYGGSHTGGSSLNIYSLGLSGQVGPELWYFNDKIYNYITLALLGGLYGGLGIPYLLEYDVGGTVELSVYNFGIGFGYGLFGNRIKWINPESIKIKWLNLEREQINTQYFSLSIMFRDYFEYKGGISLYLFKRDNWNFKKENLGIRFFYYWQLF